MNHQELLDRVAQAGLEPHGNVMPTHLVLALRAVVEIHKPYESGVCGCELDRPLSYMYPCLTIQAIERELK